MILRALASRLARWSGATAAVEPAAEAEAADLLRDVSAAAADADAADAWYCVIGGALGNALPPPRCIPKSWLSRPEAALAAVGLEGAPY